MFDDEGAYSGWDIEVELRSNPLDGCNLGEMESKRETLTDVYCTIEEQAVEDLLSEKFPGATVMVERRDPGDPAGLSIMMTDEDGVPQRLPADNDPAPSVLQMLQEKRAEWLDQARGIVAG